MPAWKLGEMISAAQSWPETPETQYLIILGQGAGSTVRWMAFQSRLPAGEIERL